MNKVPGADDHLGQRRRGFRVFWRGTERIYVAGRRYVVYFVPIVDVVVLVEPDG